MVIHVTYEFTPKPTPTHQSHQYNPNRLCRGRGRYVICITTIDTIIHHILTNYTYLIRRLYIWHTYLSAGYAGYGASAVTAPPASVSGYSRQAYDPSATDETVSGKRDFQSFSGNQGIIQGNQGNLGMVQGNQGTVYNQYQQQQYPAPAPTPTTAPTPYVKVWEFGFSNVSQ
jgi:hypothetical protein